MAIKKSGLYSSLWASCDELRGGMDLSQFKVSIKRLGAAESLNAAVATAIACERLVNR